jgi:hypothetical protein
MDFLARGAKRSHAKPIMVLAILISAGVVALQLWLPIGHHAQQALHDAQRSNGIETYWAGSDCALRLES